MAKALDLSPSTLCNIERGLTQLTMYNLLIIVDVLGISLSEFFAGIEEYNNKKKEKKLNKDSIDIEDLAKVIDALKISNIL